MLKKNIDKQKRKADRLPPIPYTRMTPTKREKQIRIERKHKNVYQKITPCDYGPCPYDAEYNCDCEYWCGEDEPQDTPEDYDEDYDSFEY